ncbi:succinylglutamate desuccinylase/aspartoacylase family protein [Silanimonas sp.]|jgi:predicted deacylase|uniref:succinylglutamate desuccinylase/aspartoacylase family protein n=1 Tax=Silanimonas sp. TaxID=1929290 RepID=UPI0037C89BEA
MRPVTGGALGTASTFRLRIAVLAALATLAAAMPLAAAPQDFPAESPRAATPVGPKPPPLIAAPTSPDDEATGELITPFQMLDRFVLPGTRQRLSWRPPDGIGRGELPSPITVLHGAKPGPVLCLIAGIHGDELNGIEVARRIGDEVDATRLNGTLVVAPIVNVFGFTRNNRYLPDRRDLNRHFPGTRSGSIASRLAHGFFNDIVRRCDALVDFHTGSFQRSNLPQIRADLTNPEVLEFTRGFGNTLVLHSPGTRGMLRLAAVGTGIPAVTFEVGAPHFLEEEHIAPAADAIRALMHRMAMLESEEHAGDDADATPIYQDSSWVRTNAGGFLFSEVQLGQTVKPGQSLGYVVDPITSRRTEILAPFPGRILGMSLNQQVLPGYAAFHIGKLSGEQQAVADAAEALARRQPEAEDMDEDPSERPDAESGTEEEREE